MATGPQRTEEHRIDTLAVRRFMSELHPNWIIRELSDRDYGIDLMMEYYNEQHPTGKTAFFQIKGSESTIEHLKRDAVVSLPFPVKTLLYAEHFPQPFFVIYLSIERNQPIYYLWLQKYIELVLDRQSPDWRDNPKDDAKISLRIPIKNDFGNRSETILKIVSANVNLQKSLNFMIHYAFWENNFIALRENKETKESNKTICLSMIDKFKRIEPYIREIIKIDRPRAAGKDEFPDFEQAKSDMTALADFQNESALLERLQGFNGQLVGVYSYLAMSGALEEAEMDVEGMTDLL